MLSLLVRCSQGISASSARVAALQAGRQVIRCFELVTPAARRFSMSGAAKGQNGVGVGGPADQRLVWIDAEVGLIQFSLVIRLNAIREHYE